MDPSPHLTEKEILHALGRLNDLLAEAGVIGEICLFGGTVMVLVFNARLSTRDVDAIFKPAPLMRELAQKIAHECDLPLDWLNDGVKGFQANHPEITTDTVPQFANLRVYRPSAEYLLAMKCMAARANDPTTSGDKGDIVLLVKHLGLRTTQEVEEIVTRFFPPHLILPKTQFMIHEVVSELKQTH
jgi:hypothetical protein